MIALHNITASLGWALVISLLPLLFIGACFLLVLRSIALEKAQLRYQISLMGLMAMLAVFGLSLFSSYRYYQKSIENPTASPVVYMIKQQNKQNDLIPEANSITQTSTPTEQKIPRQVAQSNTTRSAQDSILATPLLPQRLNTLIAHNIARPLASHVHLIGNCALIGTALSILFYAFQFIWARKLLRCSTTPIPSKAHQAVAQLKEQLGLNTKVQVQGSQLINSPLIIGGIQPTLLIPADSFWSEDNHGIRGIIAHELAHIQRHDYWFNILQLLIEALLFFHPFVWLLSRHCRLERENCCDDVAIAACGSNIVYAKALTHIEERRLEGGIVLAASGLASRESTLGRITRILSQQNNAQGSSWLPLAVALPIIILATIATYQFSQFAIAKQSLATFVLPSKTNEQSSLATTAPEDAPDSVLLLNESFDQGQASPCWLHRWISESPVGKRQFLGPFWPADRQLLYLADLEAHAGITIEFDLILIDSWGGSGMYGPSEWKLWVDQGPTLIHTTFNNIFPPDTLQISREERTKYVQHYPNPLTAAGNFMAGSGAIAKQTLGYLRNCDTHGYDFSADSIYRFKVTLPHNAESIKLYFNNQHRQWGLDNVKVTLEPNLPTLDSSQLEAFWTDLKGTEATKIDRAKWAYIASPATSLPFLQAQLKALSSAEQRTSTVARTHEIINIIQQL